ncbi:MAG: hypothetical protein RLZZ156_1060 [Deinococcota bacterium]|jgi:uncharacterized membrane protein
MNKTSAPNKNKLEWLVPTALILLSLAPVASGIFRLLEQSNSATVITPENARFFASPLPIVAHSLSGIIFLMLGALQFVPSLRRSKPGWHRMLGRILIPSGFALAFSAIWMTHFNEMPKFDGTLVYGTRMVFGVWMVLTLVVGTAAIYRRDFSNHGDWMTRAYAVGSGGNTQVFTSGWLFLFFPEYMNDLTRAITLGAGWVINIIVAEWVIRGRLQSKQKGVTT